MSQKRKRGDNEAEYACDKCRTRKIACDRSLAKCTRCTVQNLECIYSRTGVLRRERKRRAVTPSEPSPALRLNYHQSDATHQAAASSELLSHLDADIELAQDSLATTTEATASALDNLAAASASIWLECNESMSSQEQTATRNSYFLFPEQADEYVDIFIRTLELGRPLMTGAPQDVVQHLRNARPDRVRDRAWLVMFYSIVLSWVTSTHPEDNLTKRKLKRNLWLAFNDARLLLEPSEVNIQALMLLAVHVEDFTSPSLCWMLTNTAARMLQALGINHRRLDPKTRERRCMLFWWIEVVDKGLALIFARPPTNHRAMAKSIPIPALEQLLSFRPHVKNHNGPALFGAHYLYQVMCFSRLLGDIWVCLYDDIVVDDKVVALRLNDIENWHSQASQILHAAAMTEKPFLDEEGVTSIDIGLQMIEFQLHWVVIQLCRSSDERRSQLSQSSTKLLLLLPGMIAGSEEVFNGIVWQTICSPFSAFLALFKEVSSRSEALEEELRLEYLHAMGQLPDFLRSMAVKNGLAARLEKIATVLMQQAQQASSAPSKLLTLQPAIDEQIVLPDVMINWDTLLMDDGSCNSGSLQDTTLAGDQEYAWAHLAEPWSDWLGSDEHFQ